MLKFLFIILLSSFSYGIKKPHLTTPQFSENIPKEYTLKPNQKASLYIGNHIYDPNRQKITYNITGVPFGMTYNKETQTIEGIPERGEYSMVIFASNDLGYKAAYVIEVIVGAKKVSPKNEIKEDVQPIIVEPQISYPTPVPYETNNNQVNFVPYETIKNATNNEFDKTKPTIQEKNRKENKSVQTVIQSQTADISNNEEKNLSQSSQNESTITPKPTIELPPSPPSLGIK